jgi:hypothetical protein
LKAFASWMATSAWLSWISAAAAQDPGVQLVWERPPASHCPARAVLEADVEAEMGRPVFTTAENARVILRGEVQDAPSGVRVRLEARSVDGTLLGTRELSAGPGECGSLRGALGLVLTLLVEHDDPSLEQSADTSDVHVGLGLSVNVQSIPMPRTAISFGPAFALELGRVLRLRLDGAYWLPVEIQTSSGVGAKLQAFSLALRVCTRFWGDRRSFGLSLCAGGEGGPLIATPQMLEGPEQQVRLLAQGFLELHWEAKLASAGLLDVAVGPVLAFSRPSFSYVRSDGASMAVYRPQLGGIIFQIAFIILGS